jgi:hypothetical protein
VDIYAKLLEDMVKDMDNWKLRSIIADWFEDQGRMLEAECYRWTVLNRKRPYNSADSGTNYTWFNKDAIVDNLGDPESDIPESLYKHMVGGKELANHKSYSSIAEAEQAFIDAYKVAISKGWNPNVS